MSLREDHHLRRPFRHGSARSSGRSAVRGVAVSILGGALLAGCAVQPEPLPLAAAPVTAPARDALYAPAEARAGRLAYAPDRSTFAPVLTERVPYPTQAQAQNAFLRSPWTAVRFASGRRTWPRRRQRAALRLPARRARRPDRADGALSWPRGAVRDRVPRRGRPTSVARAINFYFHRDAWRMHDPDPPRAPVPWLHPNPPGPLLEPLWRAHLDVIDDHLRPWRMPWLAQSRSTAMSCRRAAPPARVAGCGGDVALGERLGRRVARQVLGQEDREGPPLTGVVVRHAMRSFKGWRPATRRPALERQLARPSRQPRRSRPSSTGSTPRQPRSAAAADRHPSLKRSPPLDTESHYNILVTSCQSTCRSSPSSSSGSLAERRAWRSREARAPRTGATSSMRICACRTIGRAPTPRSGRQAQPEQRPLRARRRRPVRGRQRAGGRLCLRRALADPRRGPLGVQCSQRLQDHPALRAPAGHGEALPDAPRHLRPKRKRRDRQRARRRRRLLPRIRRPAPRLRFRPRGRILRYLRCRDPQHPHRPRCQWRGRRGLRSRHSHPRGG